MNEKKNPLQDRSLLVGLLALVVSLLSGILLIIGAAALLTLILQIRKSPLRALCMIALTLALKERSVAGSRGHWNRIDVRFDICSGKRCEITES